MEFTDFAIIILVLTVKGTALLIDSSLMRPRIGKYTDGKSNTITGHS